MVLERTQAALQVFKKVIADYENCRVIDAKTPHCTCVYADGIHAAPVKLILGSHPAERNYEVFDKAIVQMPTMVVYIGEAGFAASWSGKTTDQRYTANTLGAAIQIVAASQIHTILTELLAQKPALVSDVLKKISPPPKTLTERIKLSAEVTGSIMNAFQTAGVPLIDVPKGILSKVACCVDNLAVPVRIKCAYNYGTTKECYKELSRDQSCLYILCGSTSILPIWSSDLTSKCPKHASLSSKHEVCTVENLVGVVCKLMQHQQKNLVSLDQIPVISAKSRQENKDQYGQNQLREMDVMQFVKTMLQDDVTLEIIQPGCKADCALTHSDSPLQLGLQFKTSQGHEFHWCCGYEGMLLICKAAQDHNYLIIPGEIAVEHINYTVGSARWSPYAVPQDQLCNFLTDIFEAVLAKKQEFTWPSGLIQDISQLQLVEPSELNKAVSEKGQLELDNIRARELLFPEFSYVYPETQTTVDVKINSVQVQDKVGDAEDANFWHVKIVKNAGNVDGKRQKKPYHEGDYQALWVFNKNNQDFFLLPAAKLVEKGVLANTKQSGKQWVSCVTPDYKGRGTQYAWTTKYYFKAPFGQEDRARLTALLESCKNS